MPNHLLSTDVGDLPDDVRGRRPTTCAAGSMICRRAEVLPVELIVRGYLAGSGWKDYQRTGAVCGIPLPAGLRESERLPRAAVHAVDQGRGGHDENISFDEMVALVGAPLAERARDLAACALLVRGRARRERRDHPRRHQVRVRHAARTAT